MLKTILVEGKKSQKRGDKHKVPLKVAMKCCKHLLKVIVYCCIGFTCQGFGRRLQG